MPRPSHCSRFYHCSTASSGAVNCSTNSTPAPPESTTLQVQDRTLETRPATG
jgi:hypothetical protein